jgi:hypothetical protein
MKCRNIYCNNHKPRHPHGCLAWWWEGCEDRKNFNRLNRKLSSTPYYSLWKWWKAELKKIRYNNR